MKKFMVSGLMVVAAFSAQVRAADKGEFQVSSYLGMSRVNVDAGYTVTGESLDTNTVSTGLAFSYRLPSGLFAELGLGYSMHQIFDWIDSVELHQSSAALGWQFEVNKWRLTPKVGIAHTRLVTIEPDLFNSDPERTVRSDDPFFEATAVRRLGDAWALGGTLRETFAEFGHARSFGVMVTYSF